MFDLTSEQQLIQATAREFAETQIRPIAAEIDRDARFPHETIKRMGELGLMGILTSEKWGGAGASFFTSVLVVEELSRVDPSVGVFVDVGQVWERGDAGTTVSGLRVTPGAGLRFVTPLGPVRLDAAYDGYPQEPGPLYFLDKLNKTLTFKRPYTPGLRSGFWRRVVVQFAVGQAF